MAREITLSEEERTNLEVLLLRAELLNREVIRLLQERDSLISKANELLKQISERHGVSFEHLRPVFQDFKLIKLESAD